MSESVPRAAIAALPMERFFTAKVDDETGKPRQKYAAFKRVAQEVLKTNDPEC